MAFSFCMTWEWSIWAWDERRGGFQRFKNHREKTLTGETGGPMGSIEGTIGDEGRKCIVVISAWLCFLHDTLQRMCDVLIVSSWNDMSKHRMKRWTRESKLGKKVRNYKGKLNDKEGMVRSRDPRPEIKHKFLILDSSQGESSMCFDVTAGEESVE